MLVSPFFLKIVECARNCACLVLKEGFLLLCRKF